MDPRFIDPFSLPEEPEQIQEDEDLPCGCSAKYGCACPQINECENCGGREFGETMPETCLACGGHKPVIS